MGYSMKALKTYSTYELDTLAEQFSAAMQIAKQGSLAFNDAARAKHNVEAALMYRRLGL